MLVSTPGRELIEAFEGCEKDIPGRPGFFTTYYDSVHVLTLGYGHTNLGNILPVINPGDIWTKQQCDGALSNDLWVFAGHVSKVMHGVTLTQYQFDALASFDFNTGSLWKSSIDDKIRAGNMDAAMATLLLYNHAGGQVLNGLTRRRKAEQLMFLGRIEEALELAGVHTQLAANDNTLHMMPKASLAA